jgi:hypothetical protein
MASVTKELNLSKFAETEEASCAMDNTMFRLNWRVYSSPFGMLAVPVIQLKFVQQNCIYPTAVSKLFSTRLTSALRGKVHSHRLLILGSILAPTLACSVWPLSGVLL